MLQLRVLRVSLVQASALAVFLFPAAAAANIITVNSAADAIADDSTCTLREAILSANTNTASGETPEECGAGAAGHDTIHFDIPGAGVHTIQPSSAFPVITEPLTIDGYSQPGTVRNARTIDGGAGLDQDPGDPRRRRRQTVSARVLREQPQQRSTRPELPRFYDGDDQSRLPRKLRCDTPPSRGAGGAGHGHRHGRPQQHLGVLSDGPGPDSVLHSHSLPRGRYA